MLEPSFVEATGVVGSVAVLRQAVRSPAAELGLVAEATGAIYGAACSGRWPEALALCESLLGSPVKLLTRRGRRWSTVATTSRGPSRIAADLDPNGVRLLWDDVLEPDQEVVAEVLEAHLVRAVELARSVRRQLDRAAAASAALDRIPFGVVLVDGHGRIARVNRTAHDLVVDLPEVTLDDDDLRLPGERGAELARLIARAVAGSVESGSKLTGHLEVPGPEGRALRILVVPLQSNAGGSGSACALFLSRSGGGFEPPEDVLARHYALTRSEARVLARLLRGLERNEIAAELGVGRETVRTHIKSIYAKVGTTRQADLVAELLRGPAGLRWD
jgi:DNA-binding CsgD family transcriptional regulator/PAS domain-containing protein